MFRSTNRRIVREVQSVLGVASVLQCNDDQPYLFILLGEYRPFRSICSMIVSHKLCPRSAGRKGRARAAIFAIGTRVSCVLL